MDIKGLTTQEVAERVQSGLSNVDETSNSRPYSDIFKSNICTLFNFVNLVLAVCVFLTGQYKNMLFMCVIVVNVCIGIVQEIRSKRTTDKLAIVVANEIVALRDSVETRIHTDDIVQDDVIKLGRGDQIPADCEVIDSSCQVNESLLTGESDLITKRPGDLLMSGSFVNSGSVWAKVVHVGAENYSSKIANVAKEKQELNSEIMKSLNAIIKHVSIILFPVGILLFSRSYFFGDATFNEAMLSMVSALVGMIPEGLILLTSTVLAVSVIRLAKKQVLVQKLYCIETLARVDTLCLDKTGTITTGKMTVSDVVSLKGHTKEEVNVALKSLVKSDADKNETAMAIDAHFKNTPEIVALTPSAIIPFNSENKWSGAEFEGGKKYVMGAAQFVLRDNPAAFEDIKSKLQELTENARVLLIAEVDGFDDTGEVITIRGNVTPIGFVCITDEIRASAKETISYFDKQGVDIKVISGDDPHTVSGIAEKVGVKNASKWIDASTLKTESDIREALKNYVVFGRVKPEQKQIFVKCLQNMHHTVAMTGDGVNDVMALKSADCSVAMAAGSDAARNVAHLVLVDNDFAHMPEVVAEGRRSINNLQRSGSLFLVKTIMSLFLGVAFVFLPWEYPFTPIQMTLFSCLCVGIPSFVLALEPNHDLVRGHFLANCIVKSIPGGFCAIIGILAINIAGNCFMGLTFNQITTCSLIALCFLGVLLIIRISWPFTPIRVALMIFVIAGLFVGMHLLKPIFDIAVITPEMAILLVSVCVVNLVIYNIVYNKLANWQKQAIENEKQGVEDGLTRLFRKVF